MSRHQPPPDYRDVLRAILRDLRNIDALIPAESSRLGWHSKKGDREAALNIEWRKNDLLRYIQTICRDHIYWAERALKK